MAGFKEYVTKRIGYILITLLVISFLIFSVTQLLPGNAAVMILGKFATADRIAAVEQQLGLNEPWYLQYMDWITNFVTGDWGTSYANDAPVIEIITTRFIRSVQLAIVTLSAVIIIGIPIGVAAATKRNTTIDTIISFGSYIGVSLPEFVTGTVLLLLFTGPILNILPFGGFSPLKEGIIPWITHLILPAFTLTTVLIAHVIRLTRSEVIGVLQSEYVRTARLKGLEEYKVLFKHALRNGLLPTITLLALDLGYLLGSIVVVEEVFTYPGLGRLIVQSIQSRDLPVVQAGVLLIAVIYTLANLSADILYTYLDPRIDYGGE